MTRLRTSIAALVAATSVAGTAAACSSSGGGSSSNAKTLTVLYSNNYVFNSDALAKKWWTGIAAQWKKQYPNIKLNLVGTGGTDVDLMNKAALLFRNKSNTPDVIQLPTTYVGQFSGSGYLKPLNSFVSGSGAPKFWSNMPAGVKQMSTIGGQVYAVNAGNNNSALLYNKQMLTKAGISMPWNPKSWQDVLAAAAKVKAAQPSVSALWLGAGVQAGPTNVLQGSGNLIYGSTSPTMYDEKSKKWVVDSAGLRATLQFYKDMFAKNLGAPTSQLFRTDAVGQPPLLMKQGKLAIAVGSNWYPTVWAEPKSAAPWPQAKDAVGIAPVPTQNGQSPGGASTLGGWAWAMAKSTNNSSGAWDFIKLAQSDQNQLNTALWSGFVPPDPTVGSLPTFINYAPPFQAGFNAYTKYGKSLPNATDFPVYARALNTVTGNLAQHPNTSVDSELATMKSMITQQLGPNKVETQS